MTTRQSRYPQQLWAYSLEGAIQDGNDAVNGLAGSSFSVDFTDTHILAVQIRNHRFPNRRLSSPQDEDTAGTTIEPRIGYVSVDYLHEPSSMSQAESCNKQTRSQQRVATTPFGRWPGRGSSAFHSARDSASSPSSTPRLLLSVSLHSFHI